MAFVLNSKGIKSSKTLAQIDLSSVEAVHSIIILLSSKRIAKGNYKSSGAHISL